MNIRLVRESDAEPLAALYRANREYLAPFEPDREESFFTAGGQATVLGECFGSHGLHRVEAATLVDNLRSQAVLRRNGFTLIGRAPRYLRIAGRWRDHLLFQRLADEPAAAVTSSVLP